MQIAELRSQAVIKEAKGDAEATRLKALGEAEAIRTTGKARAESYLVGVDALGVQGFTTLQMMQIIGERQVRIVPDVSVTGNEGGGLVESLLGMTLRNQTQTGQLLKENGGSRPQPVKSAD